MSIQELIAQGQERKAEAERQSAENARLREQAAITKHAAEWQPILQEVAKFLPPELAHVLTTPEHSARTGDSGNRRNASFKIRIPGTQIRIDCNPDTRWRQSDNPTFRAMAPEIYWDEMGEQGYYISWCRTGDEREDFLIALSEAAAAADTLPAVQAEADRKNAEWLAEESAEKNAPVASDNEHVDYLDKAIEVMDKIDFVADEFAVICVQTAQAHAMIAIAQELRRMNGREQNRAIWGS